MVFTDHDNIIRPYRYSVLHDDKCITITYYINLYFHGGGYFLMSSCVFRLFYKFLVDTSFDVYLVLYFFFI